MLPTTVSSKLHKIPSNKVRFIEINPAALFKSLTGFLWNNTPEIEVGRAQGP